MVIGDLVGEGAAQEEAVVGETPNLAARLQGLAESGQVVVAESTRRLLGDVFDLANLGLKQVKGIAAPVPVFAVLGERPVESRFEARIGPALLPMVGRDQELALLLERWAQAKAGEGQGVLLIGEAGIGKSRISRALMDALAAEPHIRIRYQCSPYHTDSALWPVIQQLSHAAGFVGDNQTEVRLAKLETLLTQPGGDARRAAPLIADLIGLDYESRYGALNLSPQAQRSRTLELLTEQLLGLAAQQPVLVVLEDAHWIDPSTLEMIQQGLDRIAAERVMILLTSRPDHQPELAAHPHVTRFTLNRLGRTGVEAIVARLGGEDLSEEIVEAIIARADGVPLFVEELTKAILETGKTSIPATLHDSLMARLDRIPEVKEVAQIAACIGREFSYTLLEAVAGKAEPEPRASLDKLASAQILLRRGTPPEAHYTFKHALVRDAAYQSLLKTKRQEIHAWIAKVLESRFRDAVELQPELIGHHYAEAGLAEPAISYWRRAAERALRQSANLEAVGHYEKALELLATLPPGGDQDRLEIDLQLGLGAALIAPRGYAAEEVRAAFARAEQLCGTMTDTARHFRALRGLWNWNLLRANLQESAWLADQLSSLAERSGEPAPQLMACRIAGTTNLALGRYEAAKQHFARGLDLHELSDQGSYVLAYGEDPGLFCYLYSAWVEDWLGHRDQSLNLVERGLRAARNSPNRYSLCFVLALSAFFHLSRREPEETRRHAADAIIIAHEQGVVQWLAWGNALHGWAVAVEGEVEKGLSQAREGFRAWCSLGALYEQPKLLILLADIHRMSGAYERGLKCLADADAIVRDVGYLQWIPELYRLWGDLLVLQSRPVEAEEQFTKAIEIACNQRAKTFQLRAATSLARLWRGQGRRTQAHDLLAPVYEWFTEGFDTADLSDAKALLAELA